MSEQPRCGTCKHFGIGRVTYHYFRYDVCNENVCLLRPKKNGKTGYRKEIAEQQRYYAAYPKHKACDKYEKI